MQRIALKNHVLNGIREPIHAISLDFYHFERNESFTLFCYCVLISKFLQSYKTASECNTYVDVEECLCLSVHKSDGVCVVSACICQLFSSRMYIYTREARMYVYGLVDFRQKLLEKILNVK